MVKSIEENEKYFQDCIQIEPTALQEEYVRIASDLAYWNAQFAEKQRDYRMASLRRDIEEARLYITTRERLTATGTKPPTEAQVDARVKIDPTYHAVHKETIIAEAEMTVMKGKCEAVRTKRDMLVSLGATVRAEMAGDPSLRSQMVGKRLRDEM